MNALLHRSVLPGETFHRLTTQREVEPGQWACRCDCSTSCIRSASDLINKKARSCGCVVVLALDVAANTGWAVWDLQRSESSITAGCFHCDSTGKGADARRGKRDDLRIKLRDLIKAHKPDVAVIESPLQVIVSYDKTKKKKGDDLLDEVEEEEGEPNDDRAHGGPNASTVLMLNQLFAVSWDMCRGFVGEQVHEVAPRSWQVVTKQFHGTTKERSIAMCKAMRIALPNQKAIQDNAADAAMIAVWAKGHLQAIKRMRQVAEQVQHLQPRLNDRRAA